MNTVVWSGNEFVSQYTFVHSGDWCFEERCDMAFCHIFNCCHF